MLIYKATNGRGYNLALGGECGFYGGNHIEETKEKQRKATKRIWENEKHKQVIIREDYQYAS